MKPKPILSIIAVASVFFACTTNSFAQKSKGVSIVRGDSAISVSINGELFTCYNFQNVSRPSLYPLLGPHQLPVTRNWPFKDVPGEEHDHQHHQSFWFAHGSINGHDFWSEHPEAGRTVHDKFTKLSSGRNEGVIQSKNKLVAADGKLIATDLRTLRFYNTTPHRVIDYEVEIFASEGDLVFGDTKEGTMAIRVAESMRVTRDKKRGEGHIVLSTGVRDTDAWSKRAEWCDYYGPVDGTILGIAIFDHPNNLRHPTWWHVRDYGLFAANPFGIHDFEKKEKGAGNFTLPKGKSLKFRYRILLHEGDEQQSKIAERYQDYIHGKTP